MATYEKTAKNFGKWFFSQQDKGYIIFAHNFQSYDEHFVLKHMLDNHF